MRPVAPGRFYLDEAEWRKCLATRTLVHLEQVEPSHGLEPVIDALADEIEDRFGSPPEPVEHLLTLCRLKQQCRAQGVERLDSGPQAVAVTFRDTVENEARMQQMVEQSKGALVQRGERLVWTRTAESNEARLENAVKMLRFVAQTAAA